MSPSISLIQQARIDFHKSLLASVLRISDQGVPSNADKGNKTSVTLAAGIAERLKAETGMRVAGQTSGNEFEALVAMFVQSSFLKLQGLRPGRWNVRQVGNRNRAQIAQYAQYAHLTALSKAAEKDRDLAAALGNDYTITPDVIITRGLESDECINAHDYLVDGEVAKHADLREGPDKLPLLHASISTKWTIRSDRAQNARSEALNLIRNRKGRQPHIVVVTGEPTPSRLASLALGTGDIDCVYHFALYELIETVLELGNTECEDLLKIMIDGKRLKDISDLPVDLAV
ncbi:MAG: NgoMIV family type II restriction endonuclease [Pseudomonadota bacterium]|nr:NgoMIV family type II restriction endonuclease [Pseudomonadota bacterium]